MLENSLTYDEIAAIISRLGLGNLDQVDLDD
jgi:hypothetical protein